ncbi:MAG TPA: bifunctional phosphoglucose/phosphomannose isomerase [Candidatus Nanoarchaeia archaeon]|nr:bifunctional phosphoglucose/phosphomannose isomerase [Candidatus Nanoarchaeia archaeon]
MHDEMYNALEKFPDQITDALSLAEHIKPRNIHHINKIIVAGMGGSGVSGDLLKSYFADADVPIFVHKDYGLPKFADSSTLVFAVSYSGNTEETIHSFKDGIKAGCKILTITSGGKLLALSEKHQIPAVKIPSGIQPRAALAYLLFPMLKILSNIGMYHLDNSEIEGTVKVLKNHAIKEKASHIAKKLVNKIPIIYSSNKMYVCSYRLKTQINENAKSMAFHHVFPELNHNEMVAYTKAKKDYHVIIFRDEDDNDRVKKRMDLTKKIIMSRGIGVSEISSTGESYLRRLVLAIHLGDWISYYLALLYGVDPVDVKIIEDFKKELGEHKHG